MSLNLLMAAMTMTMCCLPWNKKSKYTHLLKKNFFYSDAKNLSHQSTMQVTDDDGELARSGAVSSNGEIDALTEDEVQVDDKVKVHLW
jgi:hypothetical protein